MHCPQGTFIRDRRNTSTWFLIRRQARTTVTIRRPHLRPRTRATPTTITSIIRCRVSRIRWCFIRHRICWWTRAPPSGRQRRSSFWPRCPSSTRSSRWATIILITTSSNNNSSCKMQSPTCHRPCSRQICTTMQWPTTTWATVSSCWTQTARIL